MRYALYLTLVFAAAVVFQTALVPAFLPPVLRPDVCLLIGIAVLSFSTIEFGLSTIFLMGLSADLLGSGRFGLLTLCYLISAGAILLAAWRDLSRGDFGVPWIACVFGTALAHALYCLIGNLIGLGIPLPRATSEVLSLAIAACVWGLPVIYVVSRGMFRLHVMLPDVQARWTNEERMHGARKRHA
ncbi:MAG TPA: hypothetical protein VKX17_25865 [Planctomycetota bacterium]|nr:hypothetical protein [Planctomycetota bacterium]